MGKRKTKAPPKKSKMITGYIIYASEIRREIIKANPEKDFGDISKIVGFEWKKLGQEEKVMFEKRAEEQNSLFREEFSKMSELANESMVNGAIGAAGVAPDLDKLADVAAERAANEETQQQQQHEAFISNQQSQQQQQQQQQHNQSQQQLEGSFVHSPNQDSNPFMPTTNQEHQQQSFMSNQDNNQQHQNQQQAHQQQSQLRSPLPPNVMSQYASSVANYNATAAYNQQQTAYYSQLMMGQSTPTLARTPYGGASVAATAANDLLLQQQQQQQQQVQQQQQQQQQPPPMGPALSQQPPYSIVQHSQPTTNVQYCNNPACCASGRYQPYPTYPYSPPEPSVSPSTFQQQLVESSPALHKIQQEHLYKMNNIIYRKPSQVKLRPKDAGTQTDPMQWLSKIENESPRKQQLKFSKEFIKYLSLNRLGGTPPTKITAECHW